LHDLQMWRSATTLGKSAQAVEFCNNLLKLFQCFISDVTTSETEIKLF